MFKVPFEIAEDHVADYAEAYRGEYKHTNRNTNNDVDKVNEFLIHLDVYTANNIQHPKGYITTNQKQCIAVKNTFSPPKINFLVKATFILDLCCLQNFDQVIGPIILDN